MKYKVSFESTTGDGQSSDPFYNGLLHQDMRIYSKMFESGIRIQVGDLIYLDLEDYQNGYYGDSLSKKSIEWGGELDGGEIIKCVFVGFIPSDKGSFIEVRIGLENI